MTNPSADIAVIGLAVMGENLILNMESRGFTVSCFNRTTSKVDDFTNGRAKDKNILGFHDVASLAASLKRPRKVMIMVKAGAPVDATIDSLLPFLEPGDIIIDGGNSLFTDTNRRCGALAEKGVLFVGTGVSGGEEGALTGPSIMPGGHPEAWPSVKPIFQAIAAKVDGDVPCCDWVGEEGSGHFVKMVHNGIEYGDMQMICEVYHVMRDVLQMTNAEMSETFAQWNKGVLDSYLIEITRDILAYTEEDGTSTVDLILDAAGQKGTGKWTAIAALELGQPLTLIGEAVFARCLSALKDQRLQAAKFLKGPKPQPADRAKTLRDLEQALYASKIISYTQGYQLMQAAADEYGWTLNNGGIALMWRGGCIIRSAFLGRIKEAYDRNPALQTLLLDQFFTDAIHNAQESWRRIASLAINSGIPMPAITAALAYYDGYRTGSLPANLLQAQRDYFGAHTYERTDRPRGEYFHTNWTGRGGSTASSSYNV